MPSSSRHRIALILPTDAEHATRLCEGAIDCALASPGIELVDISYRNGDPEPLRGHPIDFDGALVWPAPTDAWVDRLVAAGVTMVAANRVVPAIEASVAMDGPAVARRAFDHLRGLGSKTLCFVGWHGQYVPESNPRDWMKRCCAEFAVPFQALEVFDSEEYLDDGRPGLPVIKQRLGAMLAALPKPAALWCEDDGLARIVCLAAREMGIEIPAQLAVLGTYDVRTCLTGEPKISSIPLPGKRIGHQMLQLLRDLLSGKASTPIHLKLDPDPVVARDSTRLEAGKPSIVMQAREWIRRHACEGLTVNELVDMVPMSQKTLSQRFVAEFGHTPGEEIRLVRLAAAKEYLQTTALSVERIAALCGYDQPSKFTHFFKRSTGLAPSEFRAKARDKTP